MTKMITESIEKQYKCTSVESFIYVLQIPEDLTQDNLNMSQQ